MKPPEFVDIHTHLNFSAFDKDREEVMKRALDAGVHIINVGTQKDTSESAVELARRYKGVYATIGLHPIHTTRSYYDEEELSGGGKEFTSRDEEFDQDYYEKLGKDKKVVAIGECGLDNNRNQKLDIGNWKKQIKNFEKQIELAVKLKKPLMLHIRNAYKDALEILKKYPDLKGNAHFFAGNWDEAKSFLDLGYTLSFTGVITFARDYDEVIKNTSLDMIMSETDAPYVAPTPYRGKRNEPLYVQEVVKKIAEIRGEDYEKMRAALISNAMRVFRINQN